MHGALLVIRCRVVILKPALVQKSRAGLRCACAVRWPTMNPPDRSCPDCSTVSRRDFLKTSLGGIAALSAGGLVVPAAFAAPTPASKCETLAASLFKTLSPEQVAAVCHPFDHPLREKVDNNWHINNKY